MSRAGNERGCARAYALNDLLNFESTNKFVKALALDKGKVYEKSLAER
jgi:hypothetical protein